MYTYFIYFVGWWFFTSGYKQGIYCIWGMVIFTVSTICTVKGRPLEYADPSAPQLADANAIVFDKVNGEEQAQA